MFVPSMTTRVLSLILRPELGPHRADQLGVLIYERLLIPDHHALVHEDLLAVLAPLRPLVDDPELAEQPQDPVSRVEPRVEQVQELRRDPLGRHQAVLLDPDDNVHPDLSAARPEHPDLLALLQRPLRDAEPHRREELRPLPSRRRLRAPEVHADLVPDLVDEQERRPRAAQLPTQAPEPPVDLTG